MGNQIFLTIVFWSCQSTAGTLKEKTLARYQQDIKVSCDGDADQGDFAELISAAKAGDVIAMSGGSGVSDAIRAATKSPSPYAHAAMVMVKDGQKMICESLIESGTQCTEAGKWLSSHQTTVRADLFRNKKKGCGARAANSLQQIFDKTSGNLCYNFTFRTDIVKKSNDVFLLERYSKNTKCLPLFCKEMIDVSFYNACGQKPQYSSPSHDGANPIYQKLGSQRPAAVNSPGDYLMDSNFSRIKSYTNTGKTKGGVPLGMDNMVGQIAMTKVFDYLKEHPDREIRLQSAALILLGAGAAKLLQNAGIDVTGKGLNYAKELRLDHVVKAKELLSTFEYVQKKMKEKIYTNLKPRCGNLASYDQIERAAGQAVKSLEMVLFRPKQPSSNQGGLIGRNQIR